MSLRLAGRFARREMRGGLRGFRLFLACLALGVAAIASVGSVRSAIEGGLQREGAALLAVKRCRLLACRHVYVDALENCLHFSIFEKMFTLLDSS